MEIDIDKLIDNVLIGNVDAMHLLGTIYYKGSSLEKQPELGLSWTKMASENGSAWADLSL